MRERDGLFMRYKSIGLAAGMALACGGLAAVAANMMETGAFSAGLAVSDCKYSVNPLFMVGRLWAMGRDGASRGSSFLPAGRQGFPPIR